MMKKKIFCITACMIVSLVLAVLSCAASVHFYTKSKTSELTKGEIFQFDLSTGLSPAEVLPGDSFKIKPVITNGATEEMFVFIAVATPSCGDDSIYDYNVADEWEIVESSLGKTVYAYASGNKMTTLSLEEATSPLTKKMTMKNISTADYMAMDDINVTITGYALGANDTSNDPANAWAYCKQAGNIQ